MGYEAGVKTTQYKIPTPQFDITSAEFDMKVKRTIARRYLTMFALSIVFLSVFVGTYLIWHANFIYSQTDNYKNKKIDEPYSKAADKYCYDAHMDVATWTKIDASHLHILCGVPTVESIFPTSTTSFIIKLDEKVQVYIK